MAKIPVNVNEFSVEDMKKFLDSFDHVFSDCDGVIWVKEPMPRAGEFFELMEKCGKSVNFVSNNSIRDKGNYDHKFKDAKIGNGYERLTIPSVAIAEYLKSVDLKKKVYCIACTETINVLESYGFKCEQGPDICPDYYGDFVQFLEDDPEIGAVVFDSDFKVNLAKMYRAITYLRRSDVHFVNGATDRTIPLGSGLLMIGVGVFADLVVQESKRDPIMMGKPGKMFGEFAMKRAGVTDPSKVLFIGDMIAQDIGLGKNTGFKTLLLLTSATQEDMMSQTDLRPDFYAQSLGSMVPLLEKVVETKL